MNIFKKYLDDATTGSTGMSTANFQASNFVGTIKKIKRKDGKMKYEYASPTYQPVVTKNPDGSYAKGEPKNTPSGTGGVSSGLFGGLQSRTTEQDMTKKVYPKKKKYII